MDETPDARTPRAVPGRGRAGARRDGRVVPADQRRLQPGDGARRDPHRERRAAEARAPLRSAAATRACSRVTATGSGRCSRRCGTSTRSRSRGPAGTTRPASGSAPRPSSWITSRGRRCSRRSVPDGDVAAARTVFLEVAAALLRTPLDALPAASSGPTDWDSYIDSAIDIYVRAEAEMADSSPIIRYVSAWLRANSPPPVPLGLVHGDFQPGNILVADGRPPGRHRLGVHPHRRPPRGRRLLQRQPAARQPLRRRPRGVPRRVPRAHRVHRGAGQPAR